MMKTGLVLYTWALVFNLGMVCLLIYTGGADGFAATSAGWMAAAIAAFLSVVIGIVIKGKLRHSVLVYGVPCFAMMLLAYQVSHGPSLHLITLFLVTIGRILDIRLLRYVTKN